MNGMISIILFSLTTLSGAAAGAYFSGKLTDRCELLSAYISLMQSMITYIKYSGYKLGEIFRAEQESSPCYISDKLLEVCESGENISGEWDMCVSKSGFLKAEDRQILSELGRTLGKSNAQGEIAVLELAKGRLEVQLDIANDEKKRKGRLFTTLGIMLGAAVGIMLI